jgi:hypothetical protein
MILEIYQVLLDSSRISVIQNGHSLDFGAELIEQVILIPNGNV